VVINGIRVELIERGAGKPVLFLHPGIGISPSAPVLDALAHGARLLAPAHPGFGTSELPKGMNTVDDARFETIDRAGHFPHIEQPEEFARRVLAFADADRQKARPARRASGD
jgi:pimeloyl-ACP methyl ester carboxylesterase